MVQVRMGEGVTEGVGLVRAKVSIGPEGLKGRCGSMLMLGWARG